MGWGRGFRQEHSCPCGHRASHPPLPATNWHLVCVCVYLERGDVNQQKLEEWSPCKKHHRDENLVPKECIESTGRVSLGSRSRAAQHRQEGPEWRMPYGAVWGDSHWASGHTDAQRRPPHRSTVGDTARNLQGRWRGRPLRKGQGHAATWTHKIRFGFRKEAALHYAHHPDAAPAAHSSPRHLGAVLPPRPTGFIQWELKWRPSKFHQVSGAHKQGTQRAGHQRPRLGKYLFLFLQLLSW